jgi:hypothetical protein
MAVLRSALWILAALAGAGWIAYLGGLIAAMVGYPVFADWLQPASESLNFWPLMFFFGTATLVSIRLAPGKLGRPYWKAAMRGAPRPLRAAMWVTFVGAIFGILILAAFGLLPGTTANVAGFPHFAAFYAVSCTLFVSAARIGLGEPRCENDHPVGVDMDHCSLCGEIGRAHV